MKDDTDETYHYPHLVKGQIRPTLQSSFHNYEREVEKFEPYLYSSEEMTWQTSGKYYDRLDRKTFFQIRNGQDNERDS
jgi:hypothetical protein